MDDQQYIKAVFGPMRIPFLMLVPACVCLGAASAIWEGHLVNLFYLALAFIGALAAHISVNSLNEYEDHRTGLDLNTQKTPFSGGSGTLQKMPDMAKTALMTGLVSLGVTICIGIFFTVVRGVWILPLGIMGVLVIILYTPVFTRTPFLCLIAPGIGFGTLMVMGTDFVLTGAYSWTSFTASMVPFFLVSNLLLLNQFPDVKADKSIGRKHFPIVWGNPKSAILLGFFYACTYLSILTGYMVGLFPIHSLAALMTAAVAIPTTIGAYRHANNISKLIPYMGTNVIITLLTPLLLAAGLLIASLR